MENPFQSFLKSWWIFLILGIIIALLGLGAIFDPLPAYMAFSTFIWVSFILSGIIEVGSAIAFRKSMLFWWANLIIGIILIIVGISVATNVFAQILLPIYIFSVGLIFQGISSIVFALALKNEGASWVLTLIFGILALLLGFILPFQPIVAIGTVGLFVGLTLLVIGLDFIVAAIFMNKAKKLTDEVFN